jgi:hypothetical protein
MSYNDCRHGAEMCEKCLQNVLDGLKQGREEVQAEILETLIDADSAYDFHSNCRMCEAIALIKEENK